MVHGLWFLYRRFVSVGIALGILAMLTPSAALAAEVDATFELRPHCTEVGGDDDDDEWIFGDIPSPGIVVETDDDGSVGCSSFEVLDPQRLRTRPLREGDILDIDILVDNPSEQAIARVRAWLSYDPNILQGDSIQITDKLPVKTPDEQDFDSEEGYAKMEASADGTGPTDTRFIFARLQFTVLKTVPSGTPITFYNPQPDGNSVIMAQEGTEEAYVLAEEPGVLQVIFITDEEAPEEPEPEPEEPVEEESAEPEPTNECVQNDDCASGLCIGGTCQEQDTKKPDGEACTFDSECISGICGSGICVPEMTGDTLAEEDNEDSEEDRTAFSLLQVRNLRVTTDGSTAFLAWDPLRSSLLKAYNVYYGTTSGRYIQRRTVDKSDNSLTLRNLTVGTTYYFAVRAVSTSDEESAFSREVSVTIGDPNSSTAPLTPGSINDPTPQNPLQGQVPSPGTSEPVVPGETGSSSVAIGFLVLAAIIGTMFAMRRQTLVSK